MTTPRITRAEADALFREYRQRPTTAVRNRIAERFIGIVVDIGNRVAKRLPSYIDADELIAFGMPGLLRAIESYDPSNAASFPTFATLRIRGAIFDEIRELDHVPRLTRNRTKILREARGTFYAEHGRQPEDVELQALMGLDDHDFAKVTGEHEHGIGSLSETVGGEAGREVTMAAMLVARPEVEPGTFTDAERIIREIALPRYGLRNAIFLRLRYRDGLTMREIGTALKVSESRAVQMHKDLLSALRRYLAVEAA